MGDVVVAEDVLSGARMTNALDHRGVVECVREDHAARQLGAQGRQCGIVGHKTRRKDKCALCLVQTGKLDFECLESSKVK